MTVEMLFEIINRTRIPEFQNINLGEMLYTVVKSSLERRIKNNLKYMLSVLAFHSVNFSKNGKGNDLFLYSFSYLGRQDHLLRTISASRCSQNSTTIISQKKFRIKLDFFNKMHFFLKWKDRLISNGVPNNAAFYLALILVDAYHSYCEIEEYLKKEKIIPSLFVSLCDGHPIDYYITSRMNECNVPTATLQHGLFSHFEPWIFHNSHSKYFLAYNQMTIDEAQKSGKKDINHILIVGPPSLIGKNRNYNFTKTNFHKIGVALLGKGYEKQNEEIINIIRLLCEKSNYLFTVRDHADVHTPLPQMSNMVRDRSENIETFIENSDFIVTGSSTVFFDTFVHNKIAVRYIGEQDRYEQIDDFSFRNESDLLKYFSDYYYDFNRIAVRAKKVLDYFLPQEDILKLYTTAFEKIKEGSLT